MDFNQIGFPVAEETTRKECERLTTDAATTRIARATPWDVKEALDTGVDIVDLFAPTSEAQLDAVLGAPREVMVESVQEAAALARDGGARRAYPPQQEWAIEVCRRYRPGACEPLP